MDALAPTRASLLVRLKDLGDDRSWRDFFDTYYPLIYGRVVNRGLSGQDAKEIAAEIVEGVARRLPDFDYDPRACRFKTWLFRVVGNRVAEHFRRRARSLPHADMGTSEFELLEQLPDPTTMEPDEKWEQEWKDSLAQAALDRVRQRTNPRQMQLYLYSEVDGHSVAETADHLQTTVNAVSQAKYRIRAMLREEGERLLKAEEQREQSVYESRGII